VTDKPTALNLVHRCPVCGSEQGLDALICQLIDDDQTRRLVADLLGHSLAVGGQVVRYLRLMKPAKQALRITTARRALGELVPLVVQGWFERKGRVWQMDTDSWRMAFDVVFTAHERGTLETPLTNHNYLLEVAMRIANRAEGQAEASTEQQRRQRTVGMEQGPVSLDALLNAERLEQSRIQDSINRMNGGKKP
jgi:hypothetical protein